MEGVGLDFGFWEVGLEGISILFLSSMVDCFVLEDVRIFETG